jgi:hypothetical protein
MGVDFEERVDHRRLHRFWLGRAQQALEKSDLARRCCSTTTTSATSPRLRSANARDKPALTPLIRGQDPIL